MMQKIVIKVEIHGEKCRTKAMKIAAATQGLMEGEGRDQVVVTGHGVDSVQLTNVLRKKLRYATLLSVPHVKPEDAAEKMEDEIKPIEYIGYYSSYPQSSYPYYRVVYDPYPNTCSIM